MPVRDSTSSLRISASSAPLRYLFFGLSVPCHPRRQNVIVPTHARRHVGARDTRAHPKPALQQPRANHRDTMIRPYRGKRPEIAASAYIDPAAVIIGDVAIGPDSSVWPCSVI